ncbi:hypothetical protein PIB30_078164 [Stylosanthes scabra]|uniref:Uncharacterized protein n=1 Tax=Stylosanthes scabra TaxID=79078 RepID=A0ABU6QRK1_9FABA|nr:hypothetical protein [Stylosanthes scabra]
MWLKLVVCNINPTRHETTLSMEVVLLIYALMRDMPVCLASVMRYAMNADPTKSKTHLLIFPMFITKWARDNNVPRFSGDIMVKIPKSQQFFPYGKWHEDDEEVATPVPPPEAPVDVPTPSAPSSPKPSRKELMRALRVGSVENENVEEDDDFQSAEPTGDASTYAGEESTDDE